MNRDHLTGGFRHWKGRAQTAAGSLRGDLGRQAEGAVNQIVGGARYAYGDARDAYGDLRDTYREARARASDAYDDVHARAVSTLGRGRDLADAAARRGQDLADEAVRRGRAFRARTSQLPGNERLMGLLVAAGVGFALATLMSRRSA